MNLQEIKDAIIKELPFLIQIVISPMIDKRAKSVAENLGIITYSGAESVDEL